MTITEMLEHLRAEAMKLPERERRDLVRSLQETLDDGDGDDAELHPSWHDEIARRIQRIEDGTAKTVTVDEAMSRIRARFGW